MLCGMSFFLFIGYKVLCSLRWGELHSSCFMIFFSIRSINSAKGLFKLSSRIECGRIEIFFLLYKGVNS